MVTCLWMFRVFFSFLCVPPVRVRLFTADDYLLFFSSRRLHTRSLCDWSSDVCSSDLGAGGLEPPTSKVTTPTRSASPQTGQELKRPVERQKQEPAKQKIDPETVTKPSRGSAPRRRI